MNRNIQFPLINEDMFNYMRLKHDYTAAYEQLKKASLALKIAMPQARDYLYDTSAEYTKALTEYTLRQSLLSQIIKDIEIILQNIEKQKEDVINK